MEKSRANMGIVLVIIGLALSGTTGVAAKFLIDGYGLTSMQVSALRICICSPLMIAASFPLCKGRRMPRPTKSDLPWFLVYGAAIAVYQLTYFSAAVTTAVSVVTIIAVCLAPVVVALLSRVMLKERMTRTTYIAMAGSIAGTVLIVGVSGGSVTPVGVVLSLTACVAWSMYNLCGRKLSRRFEAPKVAAVVFTIGGLLLCPFLFTLPALPGEAWLLIAYLGVVPSALTYTLFQLGVSRTSATKASIASMCEPLTAALLSVTLLGETFTLWQIAGALLLVGAMALLTFAKSEK